MHGNSAKKKLPLLTNGLSGCTDLKKADPIPLFNINFSRRPAGRPDTKLSVQSPKHKLERNAKTVKESPSVNRLKSEYMGIGNV